MPYDKETHKFVVPVFEWHILIRNNDYMVIACLVGAADPLRGYNSWGYFDGPFSAADKAYEKITEVTS